MASWKGFGKALLTGAKIVLPFISASAKEGSKEKVIAEALTHLTDRAADEFPVDASGAERGEFVTIESLKVAEAVTGKNFDSPEGRALLADLRDIDVEIKAAVAPLQVKYQEKLTAVRAYIESVKSPAQADTV